MLTATFFVVFVPSVALSQHSPYAGEEGREIKALSASEIEGYLDARGMGFGKVAELNHYPGPKHVLDMAIDLKISDEQHDAVEAAYEAMRSAALRLGNQLVLKERELDAHFAAGNATETLTRDLIAEIARIRGELRFAHVRAHLEMRALLTPEQIERYDELRGYTQ
jgi:Spy/CpxP family protein refolding chaperone